MAVMPLGTDTSAGKLKMQGMSRQDPVKPCTFLGLETPHVVWPGVKTEASRSKESRAHIPVLR